MSAVCGVNYCCSIEIVWVRACQQCVVLIIEIVCVFSLDSNR